MFPVCAGAGGERMLSPGSAGSPRQRPRCGCRDPRAPLGVAQPWWRGHVLLGRVTLRAPGTAPCEHRHGRIRAGHRQTAEKLKIKVGRKRKFHFR